MARTDSPQRTGLTGHARRKNPLAFLKIDADGTDELAQRSIAFPSAGAPDMASSSAASSLPSATPGAFPPGSEAHPSRELPDGIRKSLRAFVSRFPQLLTEYENKWVACDASGFRYVGDDWDTVYNRCLESGLRDDQFVVEYVVQGALDDLDLLSLRDPV